MAISKTNVLSYSTQTPSTKLGPVYHALTLLTAFALGLIFAVAVTDGNEASDNVSGKFELPSAEANLDISGAN